LARSDTDTVAAKIARQSNAKAHGLVFILDYPNVRPRAVVWLETDVEFEHNVTYEWNHGIGEVVTALMDHGMDLTMLVEHAGSDLLLIPGAPASIRLNGEVRPHGHRPR